MQPKKTKKEANGRVIHIYTEFIHKVSTNIQNRFCKNDCKKKRAMIYYYTWKNI